MILQVYDTVRRPRANRVLEESRRAGAMYDGQGPGGEGVEEMKHNLEGIWDYVWHQDNQEAAYEKAVEWLQTNGAFTY